MSYQDRAQLEKNGGLTALRVRFSLTPAAIAVLGKLVEKNQPDKLGCLPTQETIAYETGLPDRTVRDALKKLVSKGLISREKLPYMDKRGRWRPGKIHHYEFSPAVVDAIVNGAQVDCPIPAGIAAIGQNGELPDTGGDCRNIPAGIAGSTGGDCRNIPAGIAGEKLEVEIEEKKLEVETEKISPSAAPFGAVPLKIEGLNGNGNGNGKVNGKTGAGVDLAVIEEVSPPSPPVAESPPSPKERFNALLKEKVGTSNYYPLLNRVKEDIGTIKDRAAKDAVVEAWCDRIESGAYMEHIHQH